MSYWFILNFLMVKNRLAKKAIGVCNLGIQPRYADQMNFDPLARHYILLGCFLITWLKWSLVHFKIAAKMNFAPLSYQWLHRKSKVDQRSFWRQFESGPNFILITWSENSLIISNASQVDQSSFGLHILHMIRSPSHSLLDQNSYPRIDVTTIVPPL